LAHYQIQDVSFRYPDSPALALDGISVTIEEGAFVLLCGPSGSGKSTLLHQLKRQVRPTGQLDGAIWYRGERLDALDERASIEEIGMVFQNPDNQMVMNTVWEELTFAMENLGYSSEQMQRRIGEIAQLFGIESWLKISVHELSGGQKQLVNLASVMTLHPKVLLLDEPTAQLDPIAAKQFIQLLARLNAELSISVIISEHRIEELFPLATQVVMLREGKLTYSGEPDHVMKQIWSTGDRFSIPYLPSVSRLYLGVGHVSEVPIPLTVQEGRSWLRQRQERMLPVEAAGGPDASRSPSFRPVAPLLECKDLVFTYDKHSPLVLKRLSLALQAGELFALFGGNGSGKSTLLQVIAGALKPQRGDVVWQGKLLKRSSAEVRSRMIGYVAQNPSLYFTRDTVEGLFAERLRRLGGDHTKQRLNELVSLFEMEAVLDQHPLDLSGGQQQKTVLILMLLAEPQLLLLDEPTKGLDPQAKMKLADLLGKIREQGTAILMVSHDIEFAATYATRCGLLFDGMMVAVDETRSFMQNNYFYTTVIHRMAGDIAPTAVTMEDIWNRWII
jgi:energy-coupling factor transport system ATP-binding protein